MSKTSKSELSRLLGDDELGEQAYRLDILSRWPSLRVLDFLFTEGRSTTGEIARGVNMDMHEIRETVKALSEIGILKEVDEDGTSYWVPTSNRFRISIEDRNGLKLQLRPESSEAVGPTNSNNTNSKRGILASTKEKIDRLIELFR
jgi:hypothetical protein